VRPPSGDGTPRDTLFGMSFPEHFGDNGSIVVCIP
jgi:hypothetical protein